MLAAAPTAACAEGGAAAAWGANTHAELGAGYRDNFEESPVPVVGLNNITAIAAGSGFNLALLSNGTVSAWGGNHWGQLGDGTQLGTWEKGTPEVLVPELSAVTAVAAANVHALALLANGTVKAWGNNNYGQLGDGKGGTEQATGENQTLPKTVAGLVNVIAIAAGGGSNFALLANHTVMAWGQNNSGQLGIGGSGPEACVNELKVAIPCSTIPRPVVTQVLGAKGETELQPLRGVSTISAAGESTYAILENGHAVAFGSNVKGQLGTGGALVHFNPTPEEVKSAATGEALPDVVAVAGGGTHALALLGSGQVVGWGATEDGDLGAMTRTEECKRVGCVTTARPVPGLEADKATSVAAGWAYSLVVSGGKVYSFGRNEHGQLGDGNTANEENPTPIRGLGAVSAVVAGNTHAVALLQSGVEPPPSPVRLEPGIGSLKLVWTLHAKEYEVGLGRMSLPSECQESGESSEAGECEAAKEAKRKGPKGWQMLGEQVHGFEFSGLEAKPYALVIETLNKRRLQRKRVIVGTPLP